MNYTLEPMTTDHRQPVVDIFNHYITISTAAYQEAPVGVAFVDHLINLSKDLTTAVAKTGNSEVVGFGFLYPYHPASAFRNTAVAGYFLRPDHTRRGLGSQILNYLVVESRKLGLTTLLVNISSENAESLAFHRKQGFTECGRFRAIGRKFEREFDIIWMQRRI